MPWLTFEREFLWVVPRSRPVRYVRKFRPGVTALVNRDCAKAATAAARPATEAEIADARRSAVERKAAVRGKKRSG
jgi:hypothetical protein